MMASTLLLALACQQGCAHLPADMNLTVRPPPGSEVKRGQDVRQEAPMLKTKEGGEPADPNDLPLLWAHVNRAMNREYLALEAQLMQGGSVASRFLREQEAKEADAFARFTASTIADWIDGKGAAYAPAMASLQDAANGIRKTPIGTLDPETVEVILTQVGAAGLTKFVALRLCKERAWQPWKVLGALYYLKRHKDPATLPALLKFAVETAAPAQLNAALAAIQEIDPSNKSRQWVDDARGRLKR